jgi:N6-adenosine-specific RNA methylase IME4
MSAMSETPHTVHGRLLEAVHISGYSFERACAELKWLIQEDRWKQLGYEDGAAFVATLNFSEFKIALEQRKELARSLTAIASQRATAKLLGVDETTVRRDLGTRPAANAAPAERHPRETAVSESPSAANAAPAAFQSDGAAVAKLAEQQHDLPRKREERREERIQKLVEISNGNAPLVTDRKYPIIYADPPWRYELGAGFRAAAENHYPTMPLEEICALPVADIATPDAMLFLWATPPKLSESFQVISAWEFNYRTCAVWVKDKIGLGFYVRAQHELLLIAKRGDPPMPAESNRPASVITAARTAHSVKPIDFYELIERMYPELPKIELFCRSPREGWATWGNQAQGSA